MFRNDGVAGFGVTLVPTPNTTNSAPIAVGDLDGDGRLEIITSNRSSFGTFRLDDLHFGDYDRNGTVDEADRALYESTLGQPAVPPGAGADGDRSGVIDEPDLAIWEANLGRGTALLVRAADINWDERIDGSDFLAWQRRVGTAPPPSVVPGSADVDFSGTVDGADLFVWARHYGHGEGAGQPAASESAASSQPALASVSTFPANTLLALDDTFVRATPSATSQKAARSAAAPPSARDVALTIVEPTHARAIAHLDGHAWSQHADEDDAEGSWQELAERAMKSIAVDGLTRAL